MVKVLMAAFSTMVFKEEIMQSLKFFFFFFQILHSGMYPSERRQEYCNTKESSEVD